MSSGVVHYSYSSAAPRLFRLIVTVEIHIIVNNLTEFLTREKKIQLHFPSPVDFCEEAYKSQRAWE